MIRQIFARNLRLAWQAKGVSQAELAHRASHDRTYISSLERDVYNPTIDVVERLAKALEMDPLILLQKSARGEVIAFMGIGMIRELHILLTTATEN